MSEADDRGASEQNRTVDARVLLHPGPLTADESALAAELEHLASGRISEWKRTQRTPSFLWRGVSRATLMGMAETGQLDEALKKSGAPPVLLIESTQDSERLYEWVPEVQFREPPTEDIDRKGTEALLSTTDLLLLTVTPVEKRAVLAHLWPRLGAAAVQTHSLDLVTYRFGQFGRYRAAHVQCSMGSGGTRGSMLTAQEAIQRARPKATLVLGIAFGASRQKFHLGDVLVAEQIASYELAKLTQEGAVHRGPHHRAGVHLAERFANRRDDWHFPRGHGEVEVHQGLVLSGEKVIDRRDFRDALLREYRTALGGEMEGSGAYAAAERLNVQILLLKGICDWADGHKNDRAQEFAAAASASLAEHVLSKPDVLADLGAHDCGLPQRTDRPISVAPRKSAPRASEAVQAYLEAVSEYCSNLPYLSLHDLRSKKSLPDVYVDLRAYEAEQEKPQKGVPDLRKLVKLSISEMIHDSDRAPIVVVGEPGSGKSTLLRYMAERAWSAPNSLGLSHPHLPLLVSLPLLASMPGTLETRLRRVLNESLPLRNDLPEGFMSSWEQEVSAPWLLLIDALDEVPVAQRAQHLQWLGGTLKRLSNVRIIVTTRPTGYQRGDLSMEGLKHYEILPFDAAQISEFASKWFSDKADAFQRAFASVRVVEQESTPLLLTIAAKVFLERGFLPVSRSGLYAEMVKILLDEASQRGLETELGKRVSAVAPFALSRLALAMTEATTVDAPQLIARYLQGACQLSQDEARTEGARFLKSMSRRSGILVPRLKSVSFIHPTFQEYLTAEGLLTECGDSFEKLWERCISKWNQRAWREVALFCLGLLSDSGVNVSPLLERIWREAWDLFDACEAFEFVGTAIADGVKLEAHELDAIAERLLKLVYEVERNPPFWIDLPPVRSLGLMRGSTGAIKALEQLSRDSEYGLWFRLRALRELSRLAPAREEDVQLLMAWGTGTQETPDSFGEDWGEFRIEVGRYFVNVSQRDPATTVFASIAMDLRVNISYRLDAFLELLKLTSDAELICNVLRRLLRNREVVHQPLETLLSALRKKPLPGVPDVLVEIASRRVNPWKRCDIAWELAKFGETSRALELLDHLSKRLADSGARDYAARLWSELRQPQDSSRSGREDGSP